MMHCRTRAAGMTWNAYYRDKMNRVVGIRPIRIDDANFPTSHEHIFARRAAPSLYSRCESHYESTLSNVEGKKRLNLPLDTSYVSPPRRGAT